MATITRRYLDSSDGLQATETILNDSAVFAETLVIADEATTTVPDMGIESDNLQLVWFSANHSAGDVTVVVNSGDESEVTIVLDPGVAYCWTIECQMQQTTVSPYNFADFISLDVTNNSGAEVTFEARIRWDATP